jgi:hypothetical protein
MECFPMMASLPVSQDLMFLPFLDAKSQNVRNLLLPGMARDLPPLSFNDTVSLEGMAADDRNWHNTEH